MDGETVTRFVATDWGRGVIHLSEGSIDRDGDFLHTDLEGDVDYVLAHQHFGTEEEARAYVRGAVDAKVRRLLSEVARLQSPDFEIKVVAA